jgi:hypothetical protein
LPVKPVCFKMLTGAPVIFFGSAEMPTRAIERA